MLINSMFYMRPEQGHLCFYLFFSSNFNVLAPFLQISFPNSFPVFCIFESKNICHGKYQVLY